MSFLSFLIGEKKKTAGVAKERLQIILAHERSGRNAAEPDYLPALQRDLVAVISAKPQAQQQYVEDFAIEPQPKMRCKMI